MERPRRCPGPRWSCRRPKRKALVSMTVKIMSMQRPRCKSRGLAGVTFFERCSHKMYRGKPRVPKHFATFTWPSLERRATIAGSGEETRRNLVGAAVLQGSHGAGRAFAKRCATSCDSARRRAPNASAVEARRASAPAPGRLRFRGASTSVPVDHGARRGGAEVRRLPALRVVATIHGSRHVPAMWAPVGTR